MHLTPWDLRMLPIDYVQKGLLFAAGSEGSPAIVSRLLSSFAAALIHFYPLAGRLATIHHRADQPPSLSVAVDCDAGEGAEFVHASAPWATAADILDDDWTCRIPAAMRGFFPLDGAINHDGHSLPLVAVQVTELADGHFFACSLNHASGDGRSFWHFFNTWSEISRSGMKKTVSLPPIHDRWFDPSSPPPPIRLSFSGSGEYIVRPIYTHVERRFFNFPSKSIADLKSRAAAAGGGEISSLQALLAHAWPAVTRARNLAGDQEIGCSIAVDCRSRIEPPLPRGYSGNAVIHVRAETTAGELVAGGIGGAAVLIGRTVAAATAGEGGGVPLRWLAAWREAPMRNPNRWRSGGDVAVVGSPRCDMYGNDFGFARPAAVRSGLGNRFDGNVTVYQGTTNLYYRYR